MYSKKYTLGELRDLILKLMQRYSSNGTIYPSGEKADIENRLITSINIHLCRLWHEFSNTAKRCGIFFFTPHCIADFGNFEVCAGQSITRNAIGRKVGFCMTVCGKGRIEVSCAGTSKTYTADTLHGERIMIRGTVDNVDRAECNFVISADTRLTVCDFVVYEDVEKESGDTELMFGKNIAAAYLPVDCSKVLAVYDVSENREKSISFEVLENERILLAPKNGKSGYELEYVPYPPEFAAEASDDEAVLISPIMADALGYMCAADLCPVGDPELYSKLTYKYREILGNIYSRNRKSGIVNKFYGLIGRRGVLSRRNGG